MDSAGFLALWDAGDEHHAAAIRLQKELARKRRPFLTTEYVVDETVTLLLVRHSHNAAVDFLDTVERSEALRLEWIGPERSRRLRLVPQIRGQGVVVHRLRQLRNYARVACP